MNSLGFLDFTRLDYEAEINFLMERALEEVVFLPFAYELYKWHKEIADNRDTSFPNINTRYWEIK